MENETFDPSLYLKNVGITELNKMQKSSLNSVPENKEIILSSPTGTGKTLAFLLMILKLYPENNKGTFALIITPTRELALQITSVWQSLKTEKKITVCYGGHKREIEENNLLEAPAIIVGTPGRLCDHIRRRNIHTDKIEMVILDEFDKSLELGFTEEIEFLINNLSAVSYRILVSATPELGLPDFLKIKSPFVLDFSNFTELKTELYRIDYNMKEKEKILGNLLCQIGQRKAIIFINQKETVRNLAQELKNEGLNTVSYHGSMEQKDRETALAKFRNRSIYFLITTDLASRGLDIANVRFIIHYDLPETEQIFIHRNGRTARMESSGDIIILKNKKGNLPDYLEENIQEFQFKKDIPPPPASEWATLYISAGKKNKISKTDIAGFLMHKRGLRKEDVGLIEIKDFYSFVAVRRASIHLAITKGEIQKIKNQKVIIAPAK